MEGGALAYSGGFSERGLLRLRFRVDLGFTIWVQGGQKVPGVEGTSPLF